MSFLLKLLTGTAGDITRRGPLRDISEDLVLGPLVLAGCTATQSLDQKLEQRPVELSDFTNSDSGILWVLDRVISYNKFEGAIVIPDSDSRLTQYNWAIDNITDTLESGMIWETNVSLNERSVSKWINGEKYEIEPILINREKKQARFLVNNVATPVLNETEGRNLANDIKLTFKGIVYNQEDERWEATVQLGYSRVRLPQNHLRTADRVEDLKAQNTIILGVGLENSAVYRYLGVKHPESLKKMLDSKGGIIAIKQWDNGKIAIYIGGKTRQHMENASKYFRHHSLTEERPAVNVRYDEKGKPFIEDLRKITKTY